MAAWLVDACSWRWLTTSRIMRCGVPWVSAILIGLEYGVTFDFPWLRSIPDGLRAYLRVEHPVAPVPLLQPSALGMLVTTTFVCLLLAQQLSHAKSDPQEEAPSTSQRSDIRRKLVQVLTLLIVFAYAILLSSVYIAAIVLLTLIAIAAAIEHYDTTHQLHNSVSGSFSELQARVDKLQSALSTMETTVESLRNVQSLADWLPTIYKSWQTSKDHVISVIRWWDIDQAWWDLFDSHRNDLRDNTQPKAQATFWQAYFDLPAAAAHTPTLYQALFKDSNQAAKEVARFRLIGIIPDNITYFRAPTDPPQTSSDLLKARSFRTLLGWAWHYTIWNLGLRHADATITPDFYCRTYMTAIAPWTHVSDDTVFELFADTDYKEYARNLTQGITDSAARQNIAREYFLWLRQYAARWRYADTHFASCLASAAKKAGLTIEATIANVDSIGDGGTGSPLPAKKVSFTDGGIKLLNALGMGDWQGCILQDLTSAYCPEGRRWQESEVTTQVPLAAEIIFGWALAGLTGKLHNSDSGQTSITVRDVLALTR